MDILNDIIKLYNESILEKDKKDKKDKIIDSIIDKCYNNDFILNNFKKCSNLDGIPNDARYLIPFNSSDEIPINIDDKSGIKECNMNVCIFIRMLIYYIIDYKKHYILKEKDEVYNSKTDINYILTIADSPIKIKLFTLFLMVFALEAEVRNITFCDTKNKKTNVGIDFEFRLRVEALMQLNFETVNDEKMKTNSYLWIVHPGEFNDTDLNMLFKYLMTNTRIYKIMHGPESLDIPVLFNLIFKKDKEKIMKFTSKLIDTRYLCETYRQSIGEDRNCKYEFAIKYFGVISETKYDEMANDKYLMGPVQDINWDIHNLSSHHIKYALHDVIFLQHYVYGIFDMIKTNTPQYINTYKYILPLMRFMVCERHELDKTDDNEVITVTNVIDSVKTTVNKINNYQIRVRGKQYNLNSIYESVVKNMVIADEDIYLDLIMKVVYVRKKLSILLKYIVYSLISKNYKIHIKKDLRYEDKLMMDDIYKNLNDNNYKKVMFFIEAFEIEASKKLSIIYPIN